MIFTNKFQLTLSYLNYTNLQQLSYYIFFILKKNNILTLQINQIQLPTTIKKFTILKSPHAHKTARTQLELRTSKKIFILKNFKLLNQINTVNRISKHFIKNLPISSKLIIKKTELKFI